ncbi:YwqG family protein [Endozoicomonadaceae bacterium StTr2]
MTKAAEIVKKLEPHKLPIVKIQPLLRNADDIRSSKFGGKPYWPKGMDYPVNKEGKALYLLAQINFEEVPALKDYPQNGILQFFIEDDDLYGMDFDRPVQDVIEDQSGYRVVYHQDIIQTDSDLEQALPEASQATILPLGREYAVSFKLEQELPAATDYRFEAIAGDIFNFEEDVAEYIYENFSAVGSKLGGYANFTQEDPRAQGDEQWLLLFQLDSEWENGIEIMWGDMGVANFFIRQEDLEQQDFSRIWYNWDCS